MCPVSGDALAVPAVEGVGRDDPALASWAGECGGDGAEQGSVVVVECGSVGLAVQDAELVPKHDDLEVLGTTGANSEAGQRGDEAVRNALHSWSGSAVFPLISARDRIFGPHRNSSRIDE